MGDLSHPLSYGRLRDIPGPGPCAQRVSTKHASRQPACSQRRVCSPASSCLGKHLVQEHEGREQEARPKVQLLSLTQFQRRKRVGREGPKIALGPPGWLNGLHFMERNGLVSMQSPFSDPFCHFLKNLLLLIF